MMIHTQSVTPLTPVVIEPSTAGGAHVWLRRRIIHRDAPDTGTIWEADEVYYYATEAPTLAKVEADFDVLWDRHRRTGADRDDHIQSQIDDLTDLILGGI